MKRKVKGFQSTLPHGERRLSGTLVRCVKLFQSTLPHGERPVMMQAPSGTPLISIHAPAWGATLVFQIIGIICRDFNPRSRMGSDMMVCTSFVSCVSISIHAPAWGATRWQELDEAVKIFQSTLPHGERRHGLDIRLIFLVISIHAPAWGATPVSPFNPENWKSFQSTLPHGERLTGSCTAPQVEDFNPRSRMGSDPCKTTGKFFRVLFQSTLPHGERPSFKSFFT